MMILQSGFVDFWDDQRHIRLHPKGAGIVNTDCPALNGFWQKLLGNRSASRRQYNVNTVKGFRSRFLNGYRLTLKLQRLAG